LGYALFDDEIPAGDNPTQLAKSIAHRAAGYAPKLALDPGKAIPISVLNLRADIGSSTTLELERNLTLLLESKLAAVPEFVVLERRHAWSLGFEHSLDVASKPLLRGAYLIDGTISTDASGDNCSVALRLREPGGGQEKTATLKGGTKDPGAIADQILAEIKKDVGRVVSDSGPSLISEGDEYLHEALWAWRSNVPAAALEAVDSAELLGAAPENVVPPRIQILCSIANERMENWYPQSTSNDPTFDANSLATRVDAMLRAIQETVRYRDQKLESKLGEFVPSNGGERLRFRTSQTIATVAYMASKVLLLLERANSPRADELRYALRSITNYDPLNGKKGGVPRSNADFSGDVAEMFADDWAQTLEEELAWLRLICVDTQQVLPRDVLRDPPQTFCARFLKTPEEREKGFDDFVESLKDAPQSKRTYFVLKTHEKDPATADAAYLDYLAYIWPSRDEIATTDNYSPLPESVWSIAPSVVDRNPKAALPLVHAVLDAERPGQAGIIVLRNLWRPVETDIADAPGIWKEENAYVKRRADMVMEKEGRPDESFTSEMNSVMYYFKEKYPDVVKAPGDEDSSATSPLTVTHFWYPWKLPDVPVTSGVIINGTVAGDNDTLWLTVYLCQLEKSRLFKIHVPDLSTSTIDIDGTSSEGLAWTPQALYLPVYTKGTTNSYWQQLWRYNFSTAAWEKRTLPVSYQPQHVDCVNGSIYLETGAGGPGFGDREVGLAKYDWDDDKLTLLADSRRRPAQNQFDDTAPYRIVAIFTGPGGRPAVTTDTGTYYIQEAPGTWSPVFDGRFNDTVVTEDGRSLVFNGQGEATYIDPKEVAPIPWMAADAPLYRRAKGLPGVTGPVPTPWTKEAIWDCPPGKQKSMYPGSIAFRGGRLFILNQPDSTEDRFELLCYDHAFGRKPAHIPLSFQLTDADKPELSKHPGSLPNGFRLDQLEHPHSPFIPRITGTSKGLCLILQDAGFWFIPYSDIDAYLKAHPGNQSASVQPSTTLHNVSKAGANSTGGDNDFDAGDATSFR
jgi:hypothetical protein